jgi:hypothetical protein
METAGPRGSIAPKSQRAICVHAAESEPPHAAASKPKQVQRLKNLLLDMSGFTAKQQPACASRGGRIPIGRSHSRDQPMAIRDILWGAVLHHGITPSRVACTDVPIGGVASREYMVLTARRRQPCAPPAGNCFVGAPELQDIWQRLAGKRMAYSERLASSTCRTSKKENHDFELALHQ